MCIASASEALWVCLVTLYSRCTRKSIVKSGRKSKILVVAGRETDCEAHIVQRRELFCLRLQCCLEPPHDRGGQWGARPATAAVVRRQEKQSHSRSCCIKPRDHLSFALATPVGWRALYTSLVLSNCKRAAVVAPCTLTLAWLRAWRLLARLCIELVTSWL